MKNKIQFGSWEAATLIINLIFAQAMIIFPRDMAILGGSASWMIPIIITILALFYFMILSGLYRHIGSLDLLDISQRIGGRALKALFGLIITIFLFMFISIYLGGFAQTIKLISLDKSPLQYVELIFLFGMVVSAYYGVEAVARIHSILVPVIIAVFLLITLGVIPEFDFAHLFPVFGEGYQALAKGSIYRLSVFSPLLILFFMVPFFRKEQLKKIGYPAILVSGLLLTWSTLSYILVFPYEMATIKKIPIFQMARHIEFGNYIQRIESLIVLISSLSAALFLGVSFTFMIFITTKSLNLKHSKPIILPMAILVFALGTIVKRLNMEFIGNGIINIFWLTGMILPLLIIVWGAIKKVGRQNG